MPCEVKSESGIPTPFWGRRQLTVSSRMPRIFWLLHKSERTDPTSLAANTPTKRLANGVSGACCARAPDDQSAAVGRTLPSSTGLVAVTHWRATRLSSRFSGRTAPRKSARCLPLDEPTRKPNAAGNAKCFFSAKPASELLKISGRPGGMDPRARTIAQRA